MRLKMMAFLLPLLAGISLTAANLDPEMYMTTPELVRHWGYPAETHWTSTPDGYILCLHRIPSGKSKRFHKGPKPVVFLQHGLVDASSTWVINRPEQNFGMLLADAGYDVWLGNVRGNTYTTNHTKLSPKSAEFWAFSFDEMAAMDLPTMINYVIGRTGVETLSYFGHSQGTQIAWIEFSRNKELAKKVNFFGAFAPVARITHVEGFFKALSYFAPQIEHIVKILGIHDFVPSNFIMKELAALVCPLDGALICREAMFLMCGWDSDNLNNTRVPVYIAHNPAGTSTQNIIHWAQILKSKKLQMFDFGPKRNMEKYNSTSPPEYKITGMNIPVALVSGGNDFLADPRDVEWLEGQLNPKIIKAGISYDDYNHLDFVWGLNARERVYDKMINMLNDLYFWL